MFTSFQSFLLLRGCCAVAQKLGDCAAREQGSDPGGRGLLVEAEDGCDRGRRSGCCHSQSGAKSAVRAGDQSSFADGWCTRASP